MLNVHCGMLATSVIRRTLRATPRLLLQVEVFRARKPPLPFPAVEAAAAAAGKITLLTAAIRQLAEMTERKKAPKKDSNLNADFCDILRELAEYEKCVNRDMNKYNAYSKAASVLSKLPTRITSGDEALKLDGVGKKIAAKIQEIIDTGKLKKLEEIRRDDRSQAIIRLSSVIGIGPAKAHELVDQGLKSIADLEQHQESLTHAQKIGLRHFEDFEKRIPRAEIAPIEEIVKSTALGLDSRYSVTVCGSYRRALPTSGDVDVLLTHDQHTSEDKGKGDYLKHVVESLQTNGLVTETLSLGESKFMGVCQMSAYDDAATDDEKSKKKVKKNPTTFRRLDIRLLPIDQFYCGLLYFTGNDEFNKAMRHHALKHGFTLNEYTIRPMKGGKPQRPLPVSSEEDIFDYISFEYKTPEERSW